MSASNPTRTPVESRGQRIPGLYSRRRADGSSAFEYVGRLPGSPNVKTILLSATNKSEAVAERESLRAGVRENRVAVAADRRTRVADAVEDYKRYLDSLDGTDGEKSRRTLEDISAKLDGYLLPFLGSRKTVDVQAEDIRDLALRHKKMSRSTVLAILSVTSGFFAWCLTERLANENPVARARERYARQMLPKQTEREQRALTGGEIAAAMEFVSDSFSPVLTLLIESGIRTSEALGVTWDRLNLDAETLLLDRQLGKDGTLVPTKTKRVRTIPISAHAAAVLREHRDSQAAKGYDTETALVFVTKTGRPISRRNLHRCWVTALAKVGIEDAHLHSLRHSFISGHAERGTPVVKVSALVGHSDVQVTQKVYTRLAGTQEARIESLREALS